MNQPVRHYLAPADVLKAFCLISQVPLHELTQANRMRVVAQPRHDCMWLLRDLTTASAAQIGQLLGGRHQATVDEAVAKVADRLATDPEYRDRMRQLRQDIIAWVGAAPRLPTANQITAAIGVLRDDALAHGDARTAALALLGGGHAGA